MTSESFSKLEPVAGITTADWAGENARRWERVAEPIEAQLQPVGDLLHERAAVAAGQVVLDVGCGRGATTRRAAAAAGATGAVTGIDVAANLIEVARSLAPPGLGIDWIVGDAQRHPLPPAHFDVVISRFGVMFFDDAEAAFANLRRSTRAGGRLCVAVWQRRDRSEVMERPLEIAIAAASRCGYDIEGGPPDRGAFAFGDADIVIPTLEAAGWQKVSFTPSILDMYVGGPGTVEQIVETVMSIGALRTALEESPDEVVEAVRAALVAEMAGRHDGTGVSMTGAVAVVEAVAIAD